MTSHRHSEMFSFLTTNTQPVTLVNVREVMKVFNHPQSLVNLLRSLPLPLSLQAIQLPRIRCTCAMSSHPMHLPPYGETNVLIVRKNKMQSAESIQLIAFWLIASLITVSSTQVCTKELSIISDWLNSPECHCFPSQEVKNIGQDVKRILLEYNFAGDGMYHMILVALFFSS